MHVHHLCTFTQVYSFENAVAENVFAVLKKEIDDGNTRVKHQKCPQIRVKFQFNFSY